jgi:cyclopropane-fatty-acyl-phospholipid synthase
MSGTHELTNEILGELFSGADLAEVGVRLWDGSPWPDGRSRRATLVLNHPGALRRMFLPGSEVGLAEAYLYNDFDIEGDIEVVFGLRDALTSLSKHFSGKLKLGWKLRQLPATEPSPRGERGPARMSGERHSIERDRQAIAYHYDVSNDFYALWLDRRMIYSCGYFKSPEDGLVGAQEQKLEHICRKLRLQPGQRLLDIGCGWGGLVIYAGERFGVEAVGITLSEPQVELAHQRIREAGLEDRCRVEMWDYREVEDPGGYDALASVGMFEHVGESRLPTYFEKAWELLRPCGVFLNHGITRRATDPPDPPGSFSDAYVFPDGELTPISTSLQVAEEIGFEVRDVESLREHYAMTLRHWVRRLESNHERALQFVDEPTYRVWRLFTSGSAAGFAAGRLNVHQALLVKPGPKGESDLPLTREDLYKDLTDLSSPPGKRLHEPVQP